jgi:hypothetical protein
MSVPVQSHRTYFQEIRQRTVRVTRNVTIVAVERQERVRCEFLSLENMKMLVLCTAQNVGTVHCTKMFFFRPILTKFELSWQISIEIPSIKFHGNLSSGSRGGRTDRWTDKHTDVTKLTGIFRDYANAPKKSLDPVPIDRTSFCHEYSRRQNRMQKTRRSTGIVPLIINVDSRWWWVFSFTPQPFYTTRMTPSTPSIIFCVGPIDGLNLW